MLLMRVAAVSSVGVIQPYCHFCHILKAAGCEPLSPFHAPPPMMSHTPVPP